MKGLIFTLLAVFCIAFHGFSQGSATSGIVDGYVENIGQITDQNGRENTDVRYLFASPYGMNVQLRNTGFSYDLYQNATDGVHTHRIDIDFVDANAFMDIVPSGLMQKHTASFKTDNASGHVRAFEQVTYKEVYEAIDVVFKKDASGQIKYDVVLHPGAKLADVQLRYRGSNGMELTDGTLLMDNTIRPLHETIPVSFYLDNQKKVDVDFELQVSEDGYVVTFQAPVEDVLSETFVIDPLPAMSWAKYIGDSLKTEVRGVITDRYGDVYICGMTQSMQNIATAGAHKDTINDSIADAFLSKYDKYGNLQWSTYFGGDSLDIGNDVYVDTSLNVFLAGTTYSPTGIVDSLGHQDTLGGVGDAFLARFNEDGILTWATYLGGDSLDMGMKLSSDFDHNIYLSGLTKSDAAIATGSVFQPMLMGGVDGFVAKFDSSGVLQWSSYHGGTMYDAATGIAFGDTSVYISGVTYSPDLFVTDSVYQDTLLGTSDGFIARISPDGALLWSSYFGGENDDNMRNVKVFNNNVYFTGTTASDSNIVSVNAFQPTRGDSLHTDAYIGKMNREGDLLWSSYFGGDSTEIGVDLFFELDSNIIAYGTTASDNLPFTDSTSYQDTLAGGLDTYMTKIDQLGTLLWSTYYGGPQDDVAEAIDVYGNTAIYVVGHTYSDTILVPMGYQDTLNVYNSDQEGFFSKFRQSVSTPPGGVCNIPAGGTLCICPGDDLLLTVLGGELGTDADWVWYEGGCATSNSIGQGDSLIVTPTVTTTYFVRAESITNASDCISITVCVHNVTPIEITTDSLVCEGGDFTLEANGSGTIDWTGPNMFTSNTFQNQFTNATDSLEGWYFMEAVDSIGCVFEDSIQLDIIAGPSALLSANDVSCYGYSDGFIVAEDSNAIGYNYVWEQLFNPFSTLVGSDSLFNVSAGPYQVTITDTNNCVFVDSITVNEPDSMLIGTSIFASACTTPTGSIHLDLDTTQFDIGIDWTSLGAVTSAVDNLYSGTYEVVLTNQFGCEETYQIFVDNENYLSLDFDLITDVLCPNDLSGSATAVPINGVGPFTFNWVDTGDTTATANNLQAGDYEVIVYDAEGCSTSDTVTIGAAFDLDYTITLDSSLCSIPNGFIQVDVNPPGAATILWNTTDTTFYLNSLEPGVYTATLTDTNGCTYPIEEYIGVYNDLNVWTVPGGNVLLEIAATETIETLTNATYGTYSYSWTPSEDLSCADCPNPDLTPMEDETYTVIVTNDIGCIDSAIIDIDVFIPCLEVFIPSMFSPNGDNLNDVWEVIGTCIEQVEVMVYNQWGQQIFYSSDQSVGWDGTFQGSVVQNDQYAYQIQVTYNNGNSDSFSGFVSVVN